MHTLAIILSILSSIIFIIYMLAVLFAPKKDNTITIRGSFVTRTIDTAGNSYTINRTIEHR